MDQREDEIVAQLYFNPTKRWLILDLDVGRDAVLSMIVNPGFPNSMIATQPLLDLSSRGLATAEGTGGYRIQDVSYEGKRLPDLHVRRRPSVSGFRVDGILGFDFATHFTDLCLNVPTLRLTLRP